MHKNYDFRRAKSYRSYAIADLYRLHSDEGLHPQTIRQWIRYNHLQSMTHDGKLFIYGAIWKQYLYERNSKRKKKLKLNQLKCVKCKAIAEPLDNKILNLRVSTSGGLEADVLCGNCTHQQKRFYKRSEYQLLHNTFLVLEDTVGLLCDSSSSPNKTHLVGEEEPERSESYKNTIIPPSHTHFLKEQTNLLDLL